MHTPDTLPTTAPELHRLVLAAALAAPVDRPEAEPARTDSAGRFVIFRMGRLADGGRPMFRIINTRERLEAFAAQVAKRPALFGGGKINPPKARPMIDGDTRAARVAREALQDGDAQAAFELATTRAAGFFAAHNQNATLYMCPERIEISGHAWTLAIREDGIYRVMHPASLNTIATGYKTLARAIESARETLAQHAPERVAQEYATQTPHDTTHARALWCVQHQVTDHAEQVRELIARAAADAAIEQAQESAAVAELGTVQATAQPEESTAAELSTAEAVAELHAEGHAGGGACQSRGCVSVQTGAAPVARQGQTIASKSGKWSAQFFSRDGLPCLQFTGPDGKPRESTHDTGRERMQALQAMARDADAQNQPAHDFRVSPDAAPGVACQSEAKTKTAAINPYKMMQAMGLTPAELVGQGAVYLGQVAGNVCGGRGAIVEATPCNFQGLRLVVQLEDGRTMRPTPHDFEAGKYKNWQIEMMRHGAPYLAQLAAAVAAKAAAETSAAELAKQAKEHKRAELQAKHPELTQAGTPQAAKLYGCTLAATNMRILLKAAFKGVKFSVKTDKFAGGDAVDVRWTDGPTAGQVDAIIQQFKAGSFDSQTDCYEYSHSPFTELFGSAKYVHSHRELSDAAVSAIIAQVWPDEAMRPSLQDYKQGNRNTYDGCGRSRIYLASHSWTPTAATPAHQ